MEGLSELELVAKAMEPTLESSTESAKETEEDLLEGIDLSSLSVQDRAALQPLIDALAASAGGAEGEDLDQLLEQMDAAEGVADDLGQKLDVLLQDMRDLEAEKVEESKQLSAGVIPAETKTTQEGSLSKQERGQDVAEKIVKEQDK